MIHGCCRYFVQQVGKDTIIVDGATKDILQTYPDTQGVICEIDLDYLNSPFVPWSEYAPFNDSQSGKYDGCTKDYYIPLN